MSKKKKNRKNTWQMKNDAQRKYDRVALLKEASRVNPKDVGAPDNVEVFDATLLAKEVWYKNEARTQMYKDQLAKFNKLNIKAIENPENHKFLLTPEIYWTYEAEYDIPHTGSFRSINRVENGITYKSQTTYYDFSQDTGLAEDMITRNEYIFHIVTEEKDGNVKYLFQVIDKSKATFTSLNSEFFIAEDDIFIEMPIEEMYNDMIKRYLLKETVTNKLPKADSYPTHKNVNRQIDDEDVWDKILNTIEHNKRVMGLI